MFLTSRKGIATSCLIAVAILLITALAFGMSGLLLPMIVLTVAGLGFAFSGGDARHPGVPDTERFLVGLFAQRGYSGAFQLGKVRHRTTTGFGRSITVNFRAVATMTEPLYVPVLPPPDLCGVYTPRRLASIVAMARRLHDELGPRSQNILLRVPVDLYQRQYIVARSRQGWTFEFHGTAGARHTPRAGWSYSLQEVSREIALLQQTGKPRGAFPDAVVLDASDGRQWLLDTLQAWKRYEEEIRALQGQLNDVRSERGQDAIAAFFASIKAGDAFTGTAETLTRQFQPVAVRLEITAIDPARRSLHFTLSGANTRQLARGFTAGITHDAVENIVHLAARTRAEDAVPGAGPLIDAASTFEMDLRWTPDEEATLTGTGGDFVLRFAGTPAPAASDAEGIALAHEREIWNALAPATSYAGNVAQADGDRRLMVVFVPAADRNGVAARVEWDGCSGIFHVVRFPSRGDGYDLQLEPAAVPAPAGRTGPDASGGLRRLLLRVEHNTLKGVADTPDGPRPISLRR